MLMPTGWLFDNAFLEHDTGPGHPENAQRLQAILHRLQQTGLLDGLTHLAAQHASKDEVLLNHPPAHWDLVCDLAQRGGGYLDADTPVSPGSWDAALLAAGGTIAAVDAVQKGTVTNAFCCVRPPGHHAEAEKAMGFCLFNNIAIAARHLIAHRGLGRILIVDWDAHHGNGTQKSFYDNPRVMYFSTHQYPFYPGTGAAAETGTGEGKGFTLNVPLSAMSGDDKFIAAFTDQLVPAVERFRPQFVLLSAGFDAHSSDPLTYLAVSDTGFIRAALIIREIAEKFCQGKWVSVLEGGYDPGALAAGVENLLMVKMGEINTVEE